jgi:hypothetical protein
MWPESSRSNIRDMIVCRFIEIENWANILSKDYPHLSINAGTIRYVQTLDFIPIGEGSDVTGHIFLFRSDAGDGFCILLRAAEWTLESSIRDE